ncbi:MULTISPECIES: M20 family metallopeptidase [unclassified Bradyrhizobium]|uniref:M20 family metallopeptidase n=1 Tax=unclassified Bradyrhizobium TaxID=2631580 RepID=UPI0020B1E1DC|nr:MULTISPECIES: M20 family metallopeptidase [unclassified Bradyrhizobium]MCP3379849.1 M20 family metallopeptidase [Bradyrhizobium sp. CCGUVB4N]MCP3440685.1 M20 family metallopeptidase [Bradyrhizobium sp. CCGUVB14]
MSSVAHPTTREDAIAAARSYVVDGGFTAEMAPRIAIRSESPRQDSRDDNLHYLNKEMRPLLERMGFSCQVIENPVERRLPAMYAERIEDPGRPTILIYGHGDVLWGMAGDWKDGRDPWILDEAEGRIYGRGTADNKGQHSINLAALRIVLEKRGHLGFNTKVLIEMGEETGSLGLAELAKEHRDLLRSDCLIASDGPRLAAGAPTLFLGGRGSVGFRLTCEIREGAYHSGNWGGLLVNPGIRLAHAIATITDPTGRIAIPEWTPDRMPPEVRAALKKIALETGPEDPEIDDNWGEPGLAGAEQVYGWCNFEVLAFICGRPDAPVNAVPGTANAICQLRYVVGVDPAKVLPALRAHLDARGFSDVTIEEIKEDFYLATRTNLDNGWVQFALSSMETTLGREASLLPNFGGSLPNEVFAEIIGMATLWIPHSYPSCSQHAPNEHMLVSVVEEGMQIMTGLFWDLGEAAIRDRQPVASTTA